VYSSIDLLSHTSLLLFLFCLRLALGAARATCPALYALELLEAGFADLCLLACAYGMRERGDESLPCLVRRHPLRNLT